MSQAFKIAAAVTDPLPPDEAARLTAFARACKAAQRAVLLYPDGHAAITAALGRLVALTSTPHLRAPLTVGVLTGGLQLDGRAPDRPDTAVTELAALLHAHLIGELTVHPGGDDRAWRAWLLLLGRSPEAVRAEGGIARVWAGMAGRHVEVREVDYAEVLRERTAGHTAAWDQILAHCLQGQTADLTDPAMWGLLEIVRDAGRLGELVATLEARARESGLGAGPGADALLRLLAGVVASVQRLDPDQMDAALDNLAQALAALSPDMLAALAVRRHGPDPSEAQLVDTIVGRMSDGTIAQWVAKQTLTDDDSLDRVAQAFQALVPGEEDRARLVPLARDDAAASPLGSIDGFDEVWGHVAGRLLTSYSDRPFVSDAYGHELSSARSQAIDLDRLQDDPPDRVTAWLATVNTTALRHLDHALVLDLLRLVEDGDARARLVTPVVSLIEAQLLAHDYDAAADLVAELTRDRAPDRSPARRAAAARAFETLAGSPLLLRQVVAHLTTLTDTDFERVKRICVAVGGALVPPLAEALSTDDRSRSRERLTALLVAYGATGRQEVERLKASTNPSVRRTAVYLLREFGGTDALPELAELLDDTAPQVQREAVRAILDIGTDQGYAILEQALTTGTAASRAALMEGLGAMRDDRAALLFTYLLRRVDHRGPHAGLYRWAIDALGALRNPQGVPALAEALGRGEWWAPLRTRALRRAAAAALARIGSPEARAALEEASRSGAPGVRRAVRPHLHSVDAPRKAAA